MKGLELSRKYYEEFGAKMINESFPEYADRIAVGLCGEGSECLGFDDEFSRDHDFGAGFCMWLTDQDYEEIGDKLNTSYMCLPKQFMGFESRELYSNNEQRIGAMRTSDFYRKFTGLDRVPENIFEWRRIPEHFLSIVTSGEVFDDSLGAFSEIRKELLAFYPEDIRIKKLVARVAVMAQAGQYNYPRCIKRDEEVAALCALAEFIRATLSAIYLLNKKYMPFYKWAHRGLKDLTILNEVYYMLERIASPSNETDDNITAYDFIENEIESICNLVLDVLIKQGLTDDGDSFLLTHCEQMMQKIEDNDIRRLSVFAE